MVIQGTAVWKYKADVNASMGLNALDFPKLSLRQPSCFQIFLKV